MQDEKPDFWPWAAKEPTTSGEWMNFVDGWMASKRGEPMDALQSPFWLAGYGAAEKLRLHPNNSQTSFAMN